jgi:hypothetical protein
MAFYFNDMDQQFYSMESPELSNFGGISFDRTLSNEVYDEPNFEIGAWRGRVGYNPERSDVRKLRQAAGREIVGAVYHYSQASRETLNEPFAEGMTYQQYYAHEAEDEMRHYLDEIRLISRFDPEQRAQFVEHGLDPYLVGNRFPPIQFWQGPFTYPASERESRWLKTVEHTVESIKFELDTIQFYEDMIAGAKDPVVRRKIEEITAHQKGDLADFNQMLLKLLETEKQ